jgi:hypothetical protein
VVQSAGAEHRYDAGREDDRREPLERRLGFDDEHDSEWHRDQEGHRVREAA